MLAEASKILSIFKWISCLKEEVNIRPHFFSSFLLSLIVKGPIRSISLYANGRSSRSPSNGSSVNFCSPSFSLKLLCETRWRIKPRVTEFALKMQKPDFQILFNVITLPVRPWYNQFRYLNSFWQYYWVFTFIINT